MIYWIVDYLSIGVPAVLLVWGTLALLGQRRPGRLALAGVFALYLCAVFDVVGVPGLGSFRWSPAVNLIPFGDEKTARFFLQLGLNTAMFLPFGFFLPVLCRSFRSWWAATLAGLLLSGTIEFLQLFSFRATDVDDLLMNTLGAYLGYLLAWLLRRSWLRTQADSRREESILLGVTILIPLLTAVFLAPTIQNLVYQLPLFS